MKYEEENIFPDFNVSPRKGRWIEMQLLVGRYRPRRFLPVRGDGLKYWRKTQTQKQVVSPRKGRWIEILIHFQKIPPKLFLPVRGDGLK